MAISVGSPARHCLGRCADVAAPQSAGTSNAITDRERERYSRAADRRGLTRSILWLPTAQKRYSDFLINVSA
jgi:hypothetical protein